MKLQLQLRGAVVFLAAVLTLSTARQFEHALDTDEVTLRSRGVLRDIVVLSEENGIKVSLPLRDLTSIFGWIELMFFSLMNISICPTVATCLYLHVQYTYTCTAGPACIC